MTPELEELVSAWEAWDLAPSVKDRVAAKQAALVAVAGWGGRGRARLCSRSAGPGRRGHPAMSDEDQP